MDNKAFEKLTYGVYIVAAGKGAATNAFVATTAIQVTNDPLQIAVACNKKNFTREFIDFHKNFSVSVLKQNYTPSVLGNFGFRSGRDADKFADIQPIFGQYTGVPIVEDDCIAWFECELVQQIDLGSHILYIGKVLDSKVLSDEQPLTYAYYHEVKRGATPKNAPHGVVVDAPAAPVVAAESGGKKYRCSVCGYIYDPEVGDPDGGIAPGTAFEDIPDTWKCPLCGVSKNDFEPAE